MSLTQHCHKALTCSDGSIEVCSSSTAPAHCNDGDRGLYSPPWVPADSARLSVESWNSAEFHGISMESIWLEPQPFGFPFPWKFPLFSKEIWWKWLESESLWDDSQQKPWDPIGTPLKFHGKQLYSHCQKWYNSQESNTHTCDTSCE